MRRGYGMNAVKVFYAQVTGNDDPRWQVSSFAHASERRPASRIDGLKNQS
jgi:hypothetical protein